MPDALRFDVLSYMRRHPLFADTEAGALERLAAACQTRRLAKGEALFRAGEYCQAFFLPVVGQMKLVAASANGHEKVIELVGPGGSFGEALMMTGKPCMVSAFALDLTLLVLVPRHAVESELSQNPRLALRMLSCLSHQCLDLMSDVQSYALQSGIERVIAYLLRDQRQHESHAITVSLPASKATLASRLSLTPEYFSRVLRELEDAELIAVDRRDIHIPNARRLAAYSTA